MCSFCWFPWWTGLPFDSGYEGLESGHRVTLETAIRLWSGLTAGSQMGMSLARFLERQHCSRTMAGGAGAGPWTASRPTAGLSLACLLP